MESLETVVCHICGADRGTTRILERGQFGLPAHVCICKGCGLVFLNPRWPHARYRIFYAREYHSYYRYRASRRSERRQRMAKQVLKRVADTIFSRRFRAVLDIGAGRGETLELAKREYGAVSLNAIEPSLECQASLLRVGATMLANYVESDWLVDNPNGFDLIIMRHVLEHTLDPLLALQKVAHSLREGGVAYVAVPDMMRPRLSLRTDWFRAPHTYYFSAATLRETLRRARLEPIGGLHRVGSEIYCVARRSTGGTQCGLPSVYLRQLLVVQAYLALDRAKSLLRGLKGASDG